MNPIILPYSSTALSLSLKAGWSLAKSAAGTIDSPDKLDEHTLHWIIATVPGTVAQSLVSNNQEAKNLDDFDWWYHCQFDRPDFIETVTTSNRSFLCLDGLATIADVWLNNQLIIHSNNMFLPSRIDISDMLKESNQLTICFRSLTTYTSIKRPRPKWKTNLIGNQQLRWVRTTLLGRIPCWQPILSPVGPWRNIRIEHVDQLELTSSQLTTRLSGDKGNVESAFTLLLMSDNINIISSSLQVGEHHFSLNITSTISQNTLINLSGHHHIDSVPQWWPHTHGKSVLFNCNLKITTNAGNFIFDLGKHGFKHIELQQNNDRFGFNVNGENIFCRGVCWTTNDIISLTGDEKTLRRSLKLARDAGINMIRVGGTMVYESDNFYNICDELGIMIWQDFMFASMDYPIDDADFHDSIVNETKSQVARLSAHTSVSVYCGNTDVQQQAAMMGAPKEVWSNIFFDSELKSICEQGHKGIPYFSSTPCGGALPFHPNQGLAHYYGIGAFMRPLTDIGLVDIKFVSEGMGFSHIPEPPIINQVFKGGKTILHDPRWKKVVPRDAGAGWDFEDVRDYYLKLLFKENPIALRSYNPDLYLKMSRIVSGDMLYRVFAQWRSIANPCSGGLLWFYKDLVPGPGWGLIDSDNNPKAAYFSIRRAFVSLGVFLEDKGFNGFHIHLINETAVTKKVTLELTAYRQGNILTLEGSKEMTLEARSNLTIAADEMLEYFSDATYAYRFGPVQHEIVHARLSDSITGEYLDDDSYFPVTHSLPSNKHTSLVIDLIEKPQGDLYLQLTSSTFLQYVRLDLKFYQPEDNYFHLAPGKPREIKITRSGNNQDKAPISIKGYLEALNLFDPVKILFKRN